MLIQFLVNTLTPPYIVLASNSISCILNADIRKRSCVMELWFFNMMLHSFSSYPWFVSSLIPPKIRLEQTTCYSTTCTTYVRNGNKHFLKEFFFLPTPCCHTNIYLFIHEIDLSLSKYKKKIMLVCYWK